MARFSSLPRPSPTAHLRLTARADDMAWTLEHLHRVYGPVVDIGYRIPLRVVCLFGPKANQHVLADNADNFIWGKAFRLLEVVDGPTALVLSDGDEHRRRRRLVQPAFAIKRVDAHVELVSPSWTGPWRGGARAVSSTLTPICEPPFAGSWCEPSSATRWATWPTRSASGWSQPSGTCSARRWRGSTSTCGGTAMAGPGLRPAPSTS